jgi:hypothetical protein
LNITKKVIDIRIMDELLVGFVTDTSKLLFKPMEVSGPL